MFPPPAFSNDASLVERARAGDAGALEALVLRYQRQAHAVARAIGVGRDAVDDVVQEAFLQALRGLGGLRTPAAFRPWFLNTVRNLARKQLQEGRAVALPEEDLASSAPPEKEGEDLKQLGERLWSEVARLPEGVREAIFLYYYEGASVRRVARTLGISQSAVKSRLKRGRDELRERLWKEVTESLRDGLPAASAWKRQGRRLTLFLLASTPALPTEAAAAAIEAVATPVGTTKAFFGALGAGTLLMKSKMLLVAMSAAVVLLIGGLAPIRAWPAAPD